jgi:hypothetical protein
MPPESEQPQPPSPPRAPRDYRPDLRPMLIVLAVFIAIVVGWLLVSPLILPAPAR